MDGEWIGLIGVLVGTAISVGVSTGWEYWRTRKAQQEQETASEAEFVTICRLLCDEMDMAAALFGTLVSEIQSEAADRVSLTAESFEIHACPSWQAARPLLSDPRNGVERPDLVKVQFAMKYLAVLEMEVRTRGDEGVAITDLEHVVRSLRAGGEALKKYSALPQTLGETTSG